MPHTVHAVVVHHRGKEMLATCLESLLVSTGADLQIILVSNGCDEALPEVVEESPAIHLVECEPVGFSEANNLGVDHARRELGQASHYYFVNNDTKSSPEALELQLRAMDEDPRVAVAGPRLEILGDPNFLNSLGLNVTRDAWGWDEGIGIRKEDYGPLPGAREVLAVTGSALLMEAETFLQVGGWSEIYDYYFEDIDLCVKARRAGRTVMNVPEAVVLHRISATIQEGSDRKTFFFWRNRLVLGLAHWPPRLLGALLWRALKREILANQWADMELQRRALREALGRLGRIWSLRWRLRGLKHGDWTRFLHAPGSVPVITLPEVCFVDPDGLGAVPGGDETRAEEGSAGEAPERAVSSNEARVLPPLPGGIFDRADKSGSEAQGQRVLVLGWSPLPFENQKMNYAPGARSWQLAGALASDGHAVCLACARIPGAAHDELPTVAESEHEGVLIYQMERERFEAEGALEDLVERFRPTVLVGAAPVPSLRACHLAGETLPVWVDLFGDPMAEAQARAIAAPEKDRLSAYRNLLAELLERGDAFSAVSERQRLAAIGQLGFCGRLNAETGGHELVFNIPCGLSGRGEPVERSRQSPVPGELAEDDFVLLWSGGYNTWCDVDTLFAGLEMAMEANHRLRFVSTGGGIEGQDEGTYPRLLAKVNASPLADRFLFKGRLPRRELDAYLARADLALVTERFLYERIFGSSGRVLHWLAAGVPFLCSRLSEISEIVEAEGLGLTYPAEDPEALGRRILQAAADPEALARRAEAGLAHARQHWSDRSSTKPLREWIRQPRRAPDGLIPEGRERRENPLSVTRLQRELQAREEELYITKEHLAGSARELSTSRRELAAVEGKLQEVGSELGEIHHSKMWSLWMAYYRLRTALGAPLRWLRR